jgi:CRP-like cAMP-binding protein
MASNSINLSDKHIEVARQSKIFQKIEEKDIRDFLRNSETRTYEDGSDIVTEGATGSTFFLILEGRAEVYKQDQETGDEYLFTVLQPGDEFGELSLVIRQDRSATVRASGDVVVLELSTEILGTQPLIKRMATQYTLIRNITRSLAQKLVDTDDLALESIRSELALAKVQSAMAEFIMFIIAVMTLFSFATAIVSSSSDVAVADVFSNVATGASVIAFMIFIYRSPFSFKEFGITMPDNLLRMVLSSLVWSAGLIVVSIVGKWLAIQLIPQFADFPLIFIPGQEYPELEYTIGGLTLTLVVGYIILALVQEIMARGVMQGVLTEFFKTWKNKHLLAILLSNGLFAASHLHISLTFVVVTFFTGCLWGVQYIYQKSIVGVWISHTIVGLFGLRILGLVAMMRILEG